MTAASSQPERGSRFPTLEKYDVLEELGHGGMATVYRAHDLRLGRDVAVKVIHPHLRDSAEAVRRFAIEARAVAKLRHPNIVEVYDVSSASEREQYLVVELLRGVTLRRLLEQHGALPAEVAASIGVELLGALGHAHDEGVIHRDVKPENVILEHRASAAPKEETPLPGASPSGTFATPAAPSKAAQTPGDRIAIKLTDFGIAKLLDAQGVTSTGQVLGSPAHMAPEQIEGHEVDGRADVFGMGVLLYECMVGHLPFQGSNPAQVLRRVLEGEYPSAEREQPTVGRVWSRVLDHALSSTVDARFASAAAMRDALLGELGRLGVASPRGEIEAWLDDPAGFRAAHEAAMPGRLCARGDEALRRGDAIASAADYNRALAYAPHDAALLKLVSRLNRRSARRNRLRRTLPYAAVALAVAGVGVGVRATLARRAHSPVDAVQTSTAPLPTSPVSSAQAPAPVASSPEAVASATRTLARPAVAARPAPARSTTREVRFATVEPAQGVRVAIDGAPPAPLDPTKALVVDERAHALLFSCAADLCDPLSRAVEPGDRGVALSVRLTIKPAKLVIRGVPGNHYVLSDDPQHPLDSTEQANSVPMAHEAVRVVRLIEIETQHKQNVELRAGRVSRVDFVTPL